jgi:hypothetical protein
MNPAFVFHGIACCVALLYFEIIIQLSQQYTYFASSRFNAGQTALSRQTGNIKDS